jgi:hypothetical protein
VFPLAASQGVEFFLVFFSSLLDIFFLPLLLENVPVRSQFFDFVSRIHQQRGIPVEWGAMSFVVDHLLSRRGVKCLAQWLFVIGDRKHDLRMCTVKQLD